MIASQAPHHIPLVSHELYERKLLRDRSDCPALWLLLDEIKDPEIPAISLWDLGVLQNIELDRETQQVTVTLTPTYSACPAIEMMGDDIKTLLINHGYADCQIKTQLAPVWTTDWITELGRSQLQHFGIAPPCPPSDSTSNLACPQCQSTHTRLISEFGSTACKAAYQCDSCGEAFDYFKHF